MSTPRIEFRWWLIGVTKKQITPKQYNQCFLNQSYPSLSLALYLSMLTPGHPEHHHQFVFPHFSDLLPSTKTLTACVGKIFGTMIVPWVIFILLHSLQGIGSRVCLVHQESLTVRLLKNWNSQVLLVQASKTSTWWNSLTWNVQSHWSLNKSHARHLLIHIEGLLAFFFCLIRFVVIQVLKEDIKIHETKQIDSFAMNHSFMK